jgi:hypothetical protein
MIRPELPLLYRQALLQQIPLPCGVAKITVHNAEISQSGRDFNVIKPELPPLDR